MLRSLKREVVTEWFSSVACVAQKIVRMCYVCAVFVITDLSEKERMWEERWFCSSLFSKVGVKGGVLFTLLVKIVIAYERTLTWLTAYHVAYSTERYILLKLLVPN